jgi:hypothetical protein
MRTALSRSAAVKSDVYLRSPEDGLRGGNLAVGPQNPVNAKKNLGKFLATLAANRRKANQAEATAIVQKERKDFELLLHFLVGNCLASTGTYSPGSTPCRGPRLGKFRLPLRPDKGDQAAKMIRL